MAKAVDLVIFGASGDLSHRKILPSLGRLVARDGQDGLRQAQLSLPDLIVLDLMLPELGGLEVCRILRQETTTPVLVLSARDSELDKIVGLRVGADDYMTKPFSPMELAARLKRLIVRGA